MDSKTINFKRNLISTTATAGWFDIVGVAERIIQATSDLAINEEDETKGANLRRKAQAQRQFWNILMNEIEQHKDPEFDPDEQYEEDEVEAEY